MENFREEDADLVNEQWLEAAQENFQEAIANEDWGLALSVIADVREYGFTSQARVLEREVNWLQDKKELV